MSPDEPVFLGMNGDLMLKGLTSEDNGLYQCTVANHVGYSVCVVEVKVSGKSGGCAAQEETAHPWPPWGEG